MSDEVETLYEMALDVYHNPVGKDDGKKKMATFNLGPMNQKRFELFVSEVKDGLNRNALSGILFHMAYPEPSTSYRGLQAKDVADFLNAAISHKP